jgi:REP element-mobilizing transposase RayT
MARNPREDGPGTWHHVMNRGIARRSLFETERDIRYFLSRVARAVRDGRIEVHAFSVMTTHFHMLVRSPKGELAGAMQLIENQYSRWFNRSRRRDGTLYRGRYGSRPVRTLGYRRVLVRYIDSNPVGAGLTPDPRLYPHGSARWYARERGPIWLERTWIESCAREAGGGDAYRPEHYLHVFGPASNARIERLVERRLGLPANAEDPLDELLGAATDRVARWLQRKAALADGTEVGLPVGDGASVQAFLAEARRAEGGWTVRGSRRTTDAWPQVLVALLRDLCAETFAEAGARAQVTEAGAWKLYRRHMRCMGANDEYASRVARLATWVVEREWADGDPNR